MDKGSKIAHVQRLHTEDLLARPNVVGVGRGFKVTKGIRTDVESIIVLVREKVPGTELTVSAKVPSSLQDIPTDVVEVGDLRAQQDRTGRHRPARPGISLGHFRVTAGTFGLMVRDRASGEPLILSNNHVIANSNDALTGDPILQPGLADGGDSEADVIGALDRFCPIEFTVEPPSCSIARTVVEVANTIARAIGSRHRLQAYKVNPQATNLVDGAVARPLDLGLVDEEVLGIGLVEGTRAAALGMGVRKSGRTTGLTSGTINVIDATVTIGYGPSKRARFEGQIVTSPMSEPGDSGSALIDAGSQSVVGLLFAGSTQATIHNPIQSVIDCLEIEI